MVEKIGANFIPSLSFNILITCFYLKGTSKDQVHLFSDGWSVMFSQDQDISSMILKIQSPCTIIHFQSLAFSALWLVPQKLIQVLEVILKGLFYITAQFSTYPLQSLLPYLIITDLICKESSENSLIKSLHFFSSLSFLPQMIQVRMAQNNQLAKLQSHPRTFSRELSGRGVSKDWWQACPGQQWGQVQLQGSKYFKKCLKNITQGNSPFLYRKIF